MLLVGVKPGSELFESDLSNFESNLQVKITGSKCLVIGGAGSIGQAVTNEIFRRHPKILHVVDVSENNIVELV
jgi:FlaA1/EpsC-like NDP-sugar epimerase